MNAVMRMILLFDWHLATSEKETMQEQNQVFLGGANMSSGGNSLTPGVHTSRIDCCTIVLWAT